MSRLHFKGGAWTNAEDEVMKAALAQYGLRDWERVASMLTKKTATQCRERWENYLDPRLHIHEAWSLEEEEKLVEFQALFPHKWRLIAEQLTRRTPNHYIRPAWLCEQRYLELKDEQEYYLKEQQQQLKSVPGGAEGEKQSLESYMAERRRRRLARKTNEERAARADTVSGERFESEMVDMATSRLANQDQKKGLRKERQRQLAEAAFLAKLESNREGIESGTLSLRQSRKMKKALEEDRQTSGLVDDIVEGEDDGDGEEEGDSPADDGEDEGGERRPFNAIDMYEDQQQAGLVKKQRVLMKDLTAQQRLIQQRQVDSGAAGDDAVDAAGTSTSDSSRARAALTGVNQDLLRQLTAAPAALTPALSGSALPAITAGAPRPSITAAAAADAKAELHSTLSDLFATLPSASRATATSTIPPPPAAPTSSSDPDTTMPPPLPLPPLKRPREALHPVPTAAAAPDTQEEGTVAGHVQGGVPADFFRTLDLPAPRKYPKPDLADTTAVSSTAAAVAELSSTPPPAPGPASAVMDAAEAALYMQDARRWVAVECERAAAASSSSTARDIDAPAPAEVRRAQDLVLQELRRTDGPEDSATSREAATAMAAAVRTFTSAAAPAEYGAGVNVQHALHQLSQRVAAQVREANAVLLPLRQEWERVVSAAMLSPHDRHVLSGYVRDDGQLRGPATAAAGRSDGDAEALDGGEEGSLPAPSVAAYVYERLVGRLQRFRLETRFTVELREREALKMRRDLDELEYNLQQAQSRERTLQAMYRQKRAQQ